MDIFNLPLSEGSIDNGLKRAAAQARPIYELVRQKIEAATQLGSDETGAKVNGQKWWIWVWQNALNIFLKASGNRGTQTIEETFPNGLPNATVGSGRWAAQLKTDNFICLTYNGIWFGWRKKSKVNGQLTLKNCCKMPWT